MIEAKVVFDGDFARIAGFDIHTGGWYYGQTFEVYKDNDIVADFSTLEQAIQYCLDEAKNG